MLGKTVPGLVVRGQQARYQGVTHDLRSHRDTGMLVSNIIFELGNREVAFLEDKGLDPFEVWPTCIDVNQWVDAVLAIISTLDRDPGDTLAAAMLGVDALIALHEAMEIERKNDVPAKQRVDASRCEAVEG